MRCLTFEAKLLLYINYVVVLDLSHILWCQPVFGFVERKQIQFNSVNITKQIHNYWGMHPVACVSIKYQNTSIRDKCFRLTVTTAIDLLYI
jgi:hypothetical protein